MSDADKMDQGSVPENGADVDLERRKLLRTAWIAPVAVTLASMNPSPLQGGGIPATTTGLPGS